MDVIELLESIVSDINDETIMNMDSDQLSTMLENSTPESLVYYDEGSHGSLKYAYRLAYIRAPEEKGILPGTHRGVHPVKIVYSRKPSRNGSWIETSQGQKVLAIVDMETRETLSSAKVSDSVDFSNPTEITVGEVDPNPSKVSTHWNDGTSEYVSNKHREMLKQNTSKSETRGVKSTQVERGHEIWKIYKQAKVDIGEFTNDIRQIEKKYGKNTDDMPVDIAEKYILLQDRLLQAQHTKDAEYLSMYGPNNLYDHRKNKLEPKDPVQREEYRKERSKKDPQYADDVKPAHRFEDIGKMNDKFLKDREELRKKLEEIRKRREKEESEKPKPENTKTGKPKSEDMPQSSGGLSADEVAAIVDSKKLTDDQKKAILNVFGVTAATATTAGIGYALWKRHKKKKAAKKATKKKAEEEKSQKEPEIKEESLEDDSILNMADDSEGLLIFESAYVTKDGSLELTFSNVMYDENFI